MLVIQTICLLHSDVFFFDYGVVACWGMTKNQELTVVKGIAAQV